MGRPTICGPGHKCRTCGSDEWYRGPKATRWKCSNCRNLSVERVRRLHPTRKLFQSARARARNAGLPFSITEDDIVIPGRCPVLGIPLIRAAGRGHPLDHSPTLDRIDNDKGYVPGNVAVISWRANRLKSEGTAEEMRRIAEYMDSYARRN